VTELLNLSRLDILGEIEILLNDVTEAHLLRAGSKLDPPKKKERPLGTVHNDTAKRAYVAMSTLKAMYATNLAKASMAENDEAEQAAHTNAHKASEYADLLFEVAWSQIRSDMNYWCGNIGIRKDWLAVTWDDPQGPNLPDAIKQALGLE
jgi:hypothetical protein